VSYVKTEGLRKQFRGNPPTTAMDDLDLEIEEGEFLVLLGPSGCGKTTTLRCLAGLETPDAGRISFGDRTVFDADARVNLTPDRRNIGMVFQSYALWPHMSVRKNIGYPLRTRRGKRARKESTAGWVDETAAMVDCGNLLDRFPGQLSGGQQQRVALARGLVARPDLVLFDEPLSNLDARLRDQVRAQLHELHQRLGFTAVFVTHDQTEALALGDRLVIMRAGGVEQFDTPEHVFEHPATEYVAAFIGMANRLVLERQDSAWTTCGSAVAGELPALRSIDGPVVVRVRPDDVGLAPTDEPTAGEAPGTAVTLPATVVDSEFGGRHMDVVVAVGEERVLTRIPSGDRGGWARSLEIDQPVRLSFRPTDAMYYDLEGQRVAGAIAIDPSVPVGA
jgi:iron(III) transport system ATP-binding protein